jgi:pimeloyl-ACP methyl ester carboxylesterase
VIKTFRSSLMRWGFWRQPIRPTFAEAAYGLLNRLPQGEQHAAYDRFVYESGRAAFEAGFWLLDTQKAARVPAQNVQCPVLVIGASEDRVTPVSSVRKIAARYGALAQYKEFTDHAHWLIGEDGWEKVTEYIAGWLRTAA